MKSKKYIIHILILLTFAVHLFSINDNYNDVSDTYKYLVTAKSISVLKYNQLQWEDEPSENLILPLFPLTLSAFYFLNIDNMYLMRLFITLLALLVSYLIYFLILKIEEFDDLESAVITFIISLSPMFSIYSIAMETTIFYLLLVILLLLIVSHNFKKDKLQMIFIFLVLTAAMLTRPNAIILFPSLLIYSLLNKKFKLLWPTILSFILSFSFIFFTKNAYFFGFAFEKIFNHGLDKNVDVSFNLLNLLYAKTLIFLNNIYGYLLYWLPANIFPVNFLIKDISITLMIVFALIILIPVITGFYRRLHLKSFIEIYFIVSFLFFMIVFRSTANGRYMFPVLPIFIYYFYSGLKYLISILNERYNTLAFLKFRFFLLIFTTILFLFSSSMAYIKHYKKQPENWDDIVEIANYIKSNVDMKSKINTNSEMIHEIYLISNIQFSKGSPTIESNHSVYYLREKNHVSKQLLNGILLKKSKYGYYELYLIK